MELSAQCWTINKLAAVVRLLDSHYCAAELSWWNITTSAMLLKLTLQIAGMVL